MQVANQVVVVTGGASGIGRALCQRFHAEGARTIVVADLDVRGAEAVAAAIDGVALRCDVSNEADVENLIESTESRFGPVGLYCSNAGIAAFHTDPGNVAGAPNAAWERSWSINVMAHVYAARALLPRMIPRGGGYFLITVSAAGLLSQIGSAAYATTKHAAIGFAEILAITHRDQGIRVSVLCPQGVRTPMLDAIPSGPERADGVMSAEEVAAAAVQGVERESFLILPHAKVATYMQNKVHDYDRWLAGMAKLQRRLRSEGKS